MTDTAEDYEPEGATYSDETLQLKPLLKWAGGKRWLVPRLKTLYQRSPTNRLVEPFAGGLAVALGLNPKRALLTDINPHVINFYSQVQHGLTRSLEMINSREHYDAARDTFNHLILSNAHLSQDAAELFYYLNRTGFNGLCRFNSRGLFNVPFGRYKSINYRTTFEEYRSLFKQWDFACLDFEEIVITKDDFLYVDPPYDVEFTKYAREDFSWQDQVRLVEWLVTFSCPIVASNQATPRIVDLYQEAGFSVELVPGPRRISCTGDRTPALEIFATRNCS